MKNKDQDHLTSLSSQYACRSIWRFTYHCVFCIIVYTVVRFVCFYL